ncbi:MAG: DUF1987 domain-containing protein [Chloroflexia bacterium]|nr:DUF1987 domain-containing protein [Chloroflexia bacterium]
METLYIEAERTTPEVLLRPEADLYYITGNSFPANPLRFYEPVLEWFNKFLKTVTSIKVLALRMEFNYLNTASQKQIARLVRHLADSQISEQVLIEWYYHSDDLDMLEAGQRLQN